MKIEIYQWLVPTIVLVFLIRLSLQYFHGQRSLVNTLLWAITGLFAASLAVIPDQISYPIAEKLGFKSNINAVIFVGLGISLALNYIQSIRINQLDRRLTELVRKIAKDSPYLPKEK